MKAEIIYSVALNSFDEQARLRFLSNSEVVKGPANDEPKVTMGRQPRTLFHYQKNPDFFGDSFSTVVLSHLLIYRRNIGRNIDKQIRFQWDKVMNEK